MWHEKQNMIFPGQMMGPPLGPQATHMENMRFPPPSGVSNEDFMAQSSRKRKAVAMDQQGINASDGISQSVLEYRWPRESFPQHQVGTLSGINLQGNTLGVFSNQNPQSGEPNIMVPHFGKYQFQGLKEFSASSQINDGNFRKDAVEKMNNPFLSMQIHSLHQKGPLPLINLPAGEIPRVPDPQPRAYNVISQIEAQKHLSYPGPINTHMEKAQAGHDLKDGMNFGHINHILTNNSLLEPHCTSSESLGSLEASQLKKEESAHHVNLDGRTCIQDVCKIGSSFEVKQSGQNLDVAGTRDISRVGTGPLGTSTCAEGKETDRSFLNSDTEVRPGTSSFDNFVAAHMKGKYQSYGDLDIRTQKKAEGSNMENMEHSLGEEVSPKTADGPAKILVEHGHGDDSRNASRNLDGKSKSHAGKVASTIVEKLWDGSLQLNASVTVSAVAFFKSGEKAPEINWSKSIEVKGKVRLEAFEKFIQELPRSRNRALMVISLCWKVGSSKTGLTGMKEVARGYKEGERVGFAQLCPGIDLYVCPRSDTIITILAKYGFFKGMAAVEDNQDSLIGCVVWRRNRTSSDSVSKKSERKNLPLSDPPLNSPSNPAILRNSEANSPHGSKTGSAVLEGAGSTGSESKNIQSSKVQLEVVNSTNVNRKLTPLVPDNSPALSMGLQTDLQSGSSSLEGPMRLEHEVPLMRRSGPEKPDAGLELPRPVLSVPSQIVKPQKRPASDDDDLPEFDFSAACGVSHPVSKPLFSSNNAHVSDAVPLDKKRPAEGVKNVGGPMPPKLPILQPMTITNQQRSQIPTFPGFVLDNNQGMPLPKKLGECESQGPVLPLSYEKPVAHGSELSGRPGTGKLASGTAMHPPKNIWDDDDDDMPEWCPPDLEHRNQPSAVATSRSLIPCIQSPVPNPTSEKVPPGPSPAMPPPPPPYPIHPPLQLQGLPRGYQHCPITITVKPAQTRPVGGYIQVGPRSSLGLISNPTLRPQSNMFDVRPPIRPAGWRGWRP